MGRMSGLGQMKRLTSVVMIHDRSSSRPSRTFLASGTSIALSGFSGGVCMMGQM
jgi:hypothetical protein